jgi:inhibitor of KinA sporulation pathway (predicted exonuclease)
MEIKEMDGLYDFLVENDKPGPLLPCNSVSEFRQDLAVGKCIINHAIDYFELTLRTHPPKIHPGCIWATIGPYALNEASCVPAAMKTIVSFSQAAQDHNDQYSEYLKDVASDDAKINTVDNNNDESFAGLDDHLDNDAGDVEDEVNKSVVTYATKSPDQPSHHSHEDQRLQDMKATLKNTSLMSLAKPIFESIVNTIGSQC